MRATDVENGTTTTPVIVGRGRAQGDKGGRCEIERVEEF